MNLQPYKIGRGSVSKGRMKSLIGGQGTAQTFTTMRLMGTQQYLTAHRYQMKNSTLFLREEVEAAVKALKMGMSAGVDNIPAEFVHAGGEARIDILTAICNKIWKENGRPHGLNP